MTEPSPEPRAVVVERDLPYPPEKIWRALTQPHLIEEWLMKSDFKPVVDHRFDFQFDWGVVDCKVLEVEPQRALTYTWVSGELESVVAWMLEPVGGGTRLRMEQTGFPTGQPRYFHGARAGWPRFFDALEKVLEKTA